MKCAAQKVANISVQRRTSQGVRIIKLDDKDEVISMAKVIEPKEEELDEATDVSVTSEKDSKPKEAATTKA